MNTVITNVPLSRKSSGPGTRPLLISTPRRIAAPPEPGMPSESEGTSVPATRALFEHSGAATPSMMPVPNSSERFDHRLSSL